ncbi:MAG TPA: hypothetical protein VFJ85_10855 [Acidimicrobiales bacterium]|nr:hypothetical protein [Acidimicrobiales bacterium]
MVAQAVFTVVAGIPADRLPALRTTLAAVRADPAGNALLPFGRFDRIHFASLVLAEGPGLDPALLVLELNADGRSEACLADLVEGAGGGLDALFAGAEGWPGSGDRKAARAWLDEHVVRPGAYHIGATGRTHGRIREEARLHEAICAYLEAEDAAGRLAGVSPAEVRRRVQDLVRGDPTLAWARACPPRMTGAERLRHRIRLGLFAAAVAVGALVMLPLVVAVVVVLRVKERTDAVQQDPPDPERVRALEAEEDFVAQNHLSSVIPVKPGEFRRVLLRSVLFAINLVARVFATNGKLGDIPSIHFAHWSMVNGDRHLLFVSNFDGSWESYLGDFIDKAAYGLTSVWSNTVEFPRTRFLAFAGAADGPRFRAWARAKQCSTAAWYSAYPRSTMPIIDNNTAIREGLFARLSDEEEAAWLARL